MKVDFICFKVVAKTSYISFKIFCCTWVSNPFMLSGLPECTMCCFLRWVQIESYVFLIEKKVGLVRTKPPEGFLFRALYESKVKANNAKTKDKTYRGYLNSSNFQISDRGNGFWPQNSMDSDKNGSIGFSPETPDFKKITSSSSWPTKIFLLNFYYKFYCAGSLFS